ncbi:MAG: efflux RND transporter periplasmic adaptor subunit, partial [Xanthobacteraceae bacterium]
RAVVVSQISEGQALVDSGLQANEKIVIEGQYRLVAGTHVQELYGQEAEQADLQSSVEQEIP